MVIFTTLILYVDFVQCVKSDVNIFNLLPTHFVANIRHQQKIIIITKMHVPNLKLTETAELRDSESVEHLFEFEPVELKIKSEYKNGHKKR